MEAEQTKESRVRGEGEKVEESRNGRWKGKRERERKETGVDNKRRSGKRLCRRGKYKTKATVSSFLSAPVRVAAVESRGVFRSKNDKVYCV